MQFQRTLLNRLFAWISRETHHRFRCFDCKNDVLVPDRFLEDARQSGCQSCGGHLIPDEIPMGICCPGCPAELVSQGPVRADIEAGIYGYECQYCGERTVWDLASIPGGLQLHPREFEKIPEYEAQE